MPEGDRELGELKREVIETRNQAIKTENQIKNVSLELRGVEKRFDAFERRTRLAGLGANITVALIIVIAAMAVHAVRTGLLKGDLDRAKAEATTARQALQAKNDEVTKRLAVLEQERQQRAEAESITEGIIEHLDAGRDKEAAELLSKLNTEALSPTVQRLVGKRFGDFRRRTAEAILRSARGMLSAGRGEAAVPELRRAVTMAPDARLAGQARYFLASALWSLKRYDEAEPVLREIMKRETDKALIEEAQYLLATGLARLGRRDEAKPLLAELAKSGGRYADSAKGYVAALDNGKDLPALPAGRSSRSSAPVVKSSATPAAAAQPATAPTQPGQ